MTANTSAAPTRSGLLRCWARNVPGLRSLYRYLRHRLHVRATDDPGRLLVRLAGFRMYVGRDDREIGRSIVADLCYEPHVTAALRRLLGPGMHFLDVGANIGYHALAAARLVGPAGRVTAVEMCPENCALLRASTRANGFGNVVIHQVAAADATSSLDFCTTPGTGNGMVANDRLRTLAAGGGFTPLRSVPAVAVDDLVAEGPPVHVVKMDIEGTELRAVRGMGRLLRRHRPALVFEFFPDMLREVGDSEPAELLRAVRGHGYAIHGIGDRRTGPGPLTDEEALALASRNRFLDLLALPRTGT